MMKGSWRNALCTAPGSPSSPSSEGRSAFRCPPCRCADRCGSRRGRPRSAPSPGWCWSGSRGEATTGTSSPTRERTRRSSSPSPSSRCSVTIAPCKAEVDGIERPRRPQPVEDEPRDVLVGVLGDVRGRRGRAPGRRHQAVPRPLRLLDEPRDRDVHAPHPVQKPGAGGQLRPRSPAIEVGEGRERRCEGVVSRAESRRIAMRAIRFSPAAALLAGPPRVLEGRLPGHFLTAYKARLSTAGVPVPPASFRPGHLAGVGLGGPEALRAGRKPALPGSRAPAMPVLPK